MARFLTLALLSLPILTACAAGTAGSLGLVSAEQQACEAEREASRAEAGFRLQAAAAEAGYAGSVEAALAQDRQDAREANGIAVAAYERCMAGG